MPSKVSIFNNALRLLGEPEVVAVTSDTKYAKRLSNAWDDEVRSWFEDKDWIFARSVEQLTRVTPTIAGWTYTFNLPATNWRVLKVSRDTVPHMPGIDYELRGGKVLTDSETTYLHFIDNVIVEQIGSWPQKFADALAARLAEAVYPATDESNSTRDRIEKVRARRVKDAKAFDDQIRAQRQPPRGRYITARRHGIGSVNRGRE